MAVKTFKNVAYFINKAPFVLYLVPPTFVVRKLQSTKLFLFLTLSYDIRPLSITNSSNLWSADLCCSAAIIVVFPSWNWLYHRFMKNVKLLWIRNNVMAGNCDCKTRTWLTVHLVEIANQDWNTLQDFRYQLCINIYSILVTYAFLRVSKV